MQKHNIVYTVYCIARLQPVAGLIYWVLLIVTDAYAADDALNLIVSGVKLWTVMGPQHSLRRRKEVESFCTGAIELCWTQYASVQCFAEEISPTITRLIVPNISWDSKISEQYRPVTFTSSFTKNNSHFDTAADTVTNLVNVKRECSILQDAMLLSYIGPVWCVQSIILIVKDGSAVTDLVIF